MFSYLHGICPSNRRSAIPPPTAPQHPTFSRYYHETSTPLRSPDFEVARLRSSHPDSLNEPSPVSPDPPVLPPIPRVASHHELKNHARDSRRDDLEQEGSDASTDPLRCASPEASITPSELVPNSLHGSPVMPEERPPGGLRNTESTTQVKSPDAIRLSGKTKRPIDFAYDSMRSYSEPPRQQPFGNYKGNLYLIPPPQRKAPPPPLRSYQSQQQSQRQAPPPPTRLPPQVPQTISQKSHGKNKLNLLNPIALLARRRSSQAVQEAYSQSQTAPGMHMSDDYDPRIRGKVVHDFSAPRPGRNVIADERNLSTNAKRESGVSDTSQKKSPNANIEKSEDGSPSSTEREHIPIFKENFDDDVEPWSSDMDSAAKRRSSAFMYQMSLKTTQPGPNLSSLPAFARNLPSSPSTNIESLRKTPTPPPKVSLEVVLETPRQDQSLQKRVPPYSPPRSGSRTTSLEDPSVQTLGSPQRFKSNASRFSFDLAGVGSAAQEKLLEEKHRHNAKKKTRESVLSAKSLEDDADYDDEYADYANLDDDDGLEERIPGVNADADDPDTFDMRQTSENPRSISPNKSSFESAVSLVSTGMTSPGTPRDSQCQSTNLLMSRSSPNLTDLQFLEPPDSIQKDGSRPKSTPGGVISPETRINPLQRKASSDTNLAGLPIHHDSQDDELYFDDGLIDDLVDDPESQAFDESVFDDDTSRVYGLPLRDLKPLPVSQELHQRLVPNDPKTQTAVQDVAGRDEVDSAPISLAISDDEAAKAELRDSVRDIHHPARAPSLSHSAGLTQDNLGLHDRLAFAANQAALSGRFNRSMSQGSAGESYDDFHVSGLTGFDHETTPQSIGFERAGDSGTNHDFAFDDAHAAFSEAEDDDPIIAAANAEALENDDDGFYGQEFGFYARASSSSESEYVNGGYLGPRNIEGIHRMNSGHDKFQEPSLTPITERSEWSNRNSIMSLATYGYPLTAQYQSNPQLADLMHAQGDEMSLEALKRLRRGAWGGSNGSLQSSSQNSGSPLTYLPPGLVAPSLMHPNGSAGNIMSPTYQNMTGSFHSFSSSNGQGSSNGSDNSPSAESPTITLSTSQTGLAIHPMPPPPPLPAIDSSPVKRSMVNKPWAPGHSRNSSGAESVSYREEGGRWYLEKTRVIDETGEVEVVGRTVVEGGRI